MCRGLCVPCSAESQRWLDYQIPVIPVLAQIGSPEVAAREARKIRFERWRDTIRHAQVLIRESCLTNHHDDCGSGHTPGVDT